MIAVESLECSKRGNGWRLIKSPRVPIWANEKALPRLQPETAAWLSFSGRARIFPSGKLRRYRTKTIWNCRGSAFLFRITSKCDTSGMKISCVDRKRCCTLESSLSLGQYMKHSINWTITKTLSCRLSYFCALRLLLFDIPGYDWRIERCLKKTNEYT